MAREFVPAFSRNGHDSTRTESWYEPEGDPDCPQCHGLGWLSRGPSYRVLHDNPGPQVCDCLSVKHKARMWAQLSPWMALPKIGKYERMTMQRYENKSEQHEQAALAVSEMARGRPAKAFILIVGNPGNGKTHLCIAAVKLAHEAMEFAKYAQAADLKGDVQSHIGSTSSPSAEEMLQRYMDVDLLAIDDLGVERQTDWGLELFDRLIDARYRSEKPTIVTTNASPAEIASRLSMRIADRLMDRFLVDRFVLTAPSYRSEEAW